MDVFAAPDVKREITHMVQSLHFSHVDPRRVICMRSTGSTSRARARIWSFPKIWQQALDLGPHYIIEVLSEKFDRLPLDEQTRVLIHELMHIPKNFSGALLPHRGRGRSRIDDQSIESLFRQYKSRRIG